MGKYISDTKKWNEKYHTYCIVDDILAKGSTAICRTITLSSEGNYRL
tara:strand:- start:156 stop:296 length:141 start_codon:yes stop_codon:yes gene_type:complete